MAECFKAQGYPFLFVGSVPENLFCNSCKLVARQLTFPSCCGESYCYGCIEDIQQQHKPCPACGEENFTTIHPMKYLRQIHSLQVYCSMKERGCTWVGSLKELDNHLDIEQNSCQYVDIKCPLDCPLVIPKNTVEQHVAVECDKRSYVCQHCGFKATYDEVVNIHLPECKYVPIRCPNLCGVSCEREDMEDHLNMCRLEEVACEFSGVGCEDRFLRENEEEHIHQKSQSHLSMTAATLVTVNQQLQHRVQEQQDKIQDLEKKIQDLEKKIQDQDQKILDQDQNMQDQNKKILDQDQKLQNKDQLLQDQYQKLKDKDHKLEDQEQKLQDQIKQLQDQNQLLQNQDQKLKNHEEKLKILENKFQEQAYKFETSFMELLMEQEKFHLKHTFTIKNFSKEKANHRDAVWKGPAMYTHLCGYKFYVGIWPNGLDSCRNEAMIVVLYAMPGEYDHQLVWPAKAKFTLELINQKGGKNVTAVVEREWRKPSQENVCIGAFQRIILKSYNIFIELSKIHDFVYLDNMDF